MSEKSATELSAFTKRMKGHLANAIEASSQGSDMKMFVSQQLIDDLHEATIVLALIDLGKNPGINSLREPT